MISSVALAAVLGFLFCWDSGSGEEFVPKFGPFPRLATTPEELQEIKAAPDFEKVRDGAVRRAEPLVKEPVLVPEEWGDWIFYYANPKTGGSLEAISRTEHRDRATGEIFTDRKIVDAYTTILHGRANTAARNLGWAYAYSGDDRFAEGVKRILTKLADVYHTFPKRRDRWGRNGFLAQLGGRRYCQSLSEAVGVIALAKAYDLTRNSKVWTEDVVRHVEEDFFRPTADTLSYTTFPHNHQSWYNAGLMSIASVLGDAQMVNRVLNMRRGFLYQLEHNVDADGMWNEGTMAYHNYALQALVELVDGARRLGIPMHEDRRFRSLIEAPLKYCYPNGQLPAINDSDRSNVRSFNRHFLWAWKVYGDPLFARAYAGGNAKKLKELLGEDAEVGQVLETRSIDLKGIGLMVLRRGAGKSAVTVMLDYGAHGAAHGHPDKMNLIIFANGREWLFDPGRLSYRYPEYKTYYTKTAAHNTVIIKGRSQRPDDGELLFMDVRDGYAACGAESRGAYSPSVLRRYLLVTEKLLIDVFEVILRRKAQIDWLAHAAVPELEPVGDYGEPKPGAEVGKRDGYQHFSDAHSRKVAGPSQWEFVAKGDLKLRLWIDGLEKEQIITARRYGYSKSERTPCLIRRVKSRLVKFVTVYDLTGSGDYISAVEAPEGKALKVGVVTRDGTWAVEFSTKGVSASITETIAEE